MLFADDPIVVAIQAAQAVALAAIAAWVAVSVRRIHAQVREAELRLRYQQRHIESLEADVERIKGESGILKKPQSGSRPHKPVE